MKTIINNKLIEFNFVLFPIWILPVYFLLKIIFNGPEIPYLIFLILLGETHFASTFLFYFDKKNKLYVKSNKFILVYIPIILSLSYFFLGLKYFSIAILIGAIASGIHVTRQSIGISRIYASNKNNLIEFLIYTSSFFFLIVGFIRFYYQDYSDFLLTIFPSNINDFVKYFMDLINNKILMTIIVIFFSSFALLEKADLKKKISNLCGVVLYSPYLFVNDIYDAIIIGVGAHWSQYLVINYKVYFYKSKLDINKKLQILFIISYVLIMGIILYTYHLNVRIIEILILLPLTSQFFHYYVDAFLWRFSIKELRENIGTRLFAK